MSKVDKFQKSDIEKAIKGSSGLISTIAKRLNVTWHTAKKAVEMHDLQHLVDDENQTLIDFTESKLLENIQNNDTTSILFYLKTKGKNRGYVERTEHHNTEISVTIGDSDDES